MNCVKRNCVYALMGLFACFYTFSAMGKENNILDQANPIDHFQWQEHGKLSWDDFKGEVNATYDESAAATCCSIGFKTNAATSDSKLEVIVYNIFYAKKSWVRADAKIQSILDHEQGHFDLCEVYTRMLKQRIHNIDLAAQGVKQELMRIYSELSSEYETRQQAYEQETIHGTDIAEQKRWQEMIANEIQNN